ncbi:MAG: PIN domain nuclease [Acidimicrobiales bacterium]|nr:MAG: PIN domain nuclease [Acidimicrobiales bacterium]
MNLNVLIDSHVLIWALYEPSKIGKIAQKLLMTDREVYCSTVSLWELTLKYHKKKLPYSPDELYIGARELGVEILDLKGEHVRALTSIDTNHSDPFDRMLITQAARESLLFMTADKTLLELNMPFIRKASE